MKKKKNDKKIKICVKMSQSDKNCKKFAQIIY